MRFLRSKLMCLSAFALIFLSFSSAYSQQFPPQGRTLQFLGRYSTGLYNQAAAEIASYDPATKTAYLSSAVAVRFDAVSLADPKNPVLTFTVDLSQYGSAINSVAVKNGVVAVAMEAPLRTDNGSVVLFTTAGQFINQVAVGAQPDMLMFTPDGTKILTANEGEPNSNYSIDPEGSVTVIDISAGAANATATTIGFTSYNARRQELLAKGIRVFGPNATVAHDLEPEYIAVSPDGTKAMVTLQEANGFAVIDLVGKTLVDILPLGTKDWGRGLPRLEKYTIDNRPLLGTTAAGQNILLGGFSGLYFEGMTSNGKMKFLTNPDRGPNAEPFMVGGIAKRPFALPNYQSRLVRFEFDTTTKAINITQQLLLYREDGVTPISGRPNLQTATQGMAYCDEFGIDLYGNPIPNDEFGGDMEGVVVAPNGTFYLVDEYRPAIYNFDTTGKLINRFVPEGTAAAAGRLAGVFGTEALPALYGSRRINRGFEAVAIEGNKLYCFIQSGLDNPDVANDNTSKNANFCRIVEFDITTNTVTGEYIYPMFERAFLTDKIGDACSMGNGRFMLIERDDATGPSARKTIFEINLYGATNTFTNPPVLAAGKTVENSTYDELIAANVRPVFKRKAVHLPSIGYDQSDKVEGLARIDDNTFAVINDNDFGVGGSILTAVPDGLIAVKPTPEVLGIIHFDRSNQIDASDRDGAGATTSINFRNWQNLYGMFLPDAIGSFSANGLPYYITANEGDTRDYTGFSEERRISDAARVPLNPLFFPNASTLRQDANLGRLNVTSFNNAGALTASSFSTGDLNGDGIFEMLHSFGGRSFSIWNAEGNLVWDSGDELEKRTAFLFPNNFNASHTANTRDGRSTSKGPEPEAIAVGTVNGRTFAFIGMERIGGIAIWDVTIPKSPTYVDYLNTRAFNATFNYPTEGDLGPESITFISGTDSPNGVPMLLVANEISGTVAVFQINPSLVYVNTTTGDDNNTGTTADNVPSGTGPKKTIQGGISGVANEGRVEVSAGTYNEAVTINKQALIIGPTLVNGAPTATLNGANGMAVTAVGPDTKMFQRLKIGIANDENARIATIPSGTSGNVVLIGNAQIGGSNVTPSVAAPYINDANDSGFGTGKFLFGPLSAPTPSLVLQLDASSVSQTNGSLLPLWKDLAGGNNNAIQNNNSWRPTFEAKNSDLNDKSTASFGLNKGLEIPVDSFLAL
ncbi:MAG: esterase-like activity of phytase family protein [Ignavibacteriae bacterium]|nr:esterase-like activity of phytase family protein [Ignavibacteriota bacterium]